MFEGNGANRNILNQYASYVNRWTPENPTDENFRTNGHGPIGVYSSRTIEDGSFLRLKTLSLEYTLPNDFSKKIRMQRLSVYGAAQNLYTWTNYSGMDPEASIGRSILNPGFDYSTYPMARTINFGIKATL